METTVPEISVVVCTYNRGRQLIHTLSSLFNQSGPRTEYEVIVVDNNPIPDTDIKCLVESYGFAEGSMHSDHIRYVHCELTGLSAARNVGLSEASAEVVCFLDDDTIVLPGWLETVKRAFSQHPEAGVIGGHIILNTPKPSPRALIPGFESYWSQFVTGCTGYTEVDVWEEFPWGANWCVRRKALLDIGGFPLEYGRSGCNSWGGEELVVASKLRRLGYKIAIEPRAIVLHYVDPRRYTLGHVWRAVVADLMVRYRATKDGFVEGNASRLLVPRRAGKKLRDLFVGLIDFSTSPEHKFALMMPIFARLVLVLLMTLAWIETRYLRIVASSQVGVFARARPSIGLVVPRPKPPPSR